jgi:hypothetical protein
VPHAGTLVARYNSSKLESVFFFSQKVNELNLYFICLRSLQKDFCPKNSVNLFHDESTSSSMLGHVACTAAKVNPSHPICSHEPAEKRELV